ncbi:GGDEF domain-containing protein [Anaerosolibacter sp.]|uniref:GGDEF domain-containing protein n=1 Tax=Anaerosolibacter sp. TaxID=1872527 RepID=UPI0039EE41B6
MQILISNITILITFMFLGGEIFKDNRLIHTAPLGTRAIGGLIAGIMGCMVIGFSVSIVPDEILDLRLFALIVTAIHGGFIATIIAGGIMAIFQIVYFGIDHVSIINVCLIISMSIICGFISKLNISENRKWILMNLSSVFGFSIVLTIILDDVNILSYTLLYFWIISGIAGYTISYLSKHIVLSNTLYQKYKFESTKDFLTGLNNVREFDVLMNNIIESSKLNQEKLSLLMIDIDHFKKVNDTYGHLAGDAILKELSNVLLHSCRSIDIVSRTGGEEFCIILPDCPSNRAIEVAERVRRAVQDHVFILHNNQNIKITISVGVATFPDTICSINDIIEEADKALYVSKYTGRNVVSLNN